MIIAATIISAAKLIPNVESISTKFSLKLLYIIRSPESTLNTATNGALIKIKLIQNTPIRYAALKNVSFL